jgi:hypothetical protein
MKRRMAPSTGIMPVGNWGVHAWSIDPAGKVPAGPTPTMAVLHRREQVCAFPHGEVRQCLVHG